MFRIEFHSLCIINKTIHPYRLILEDEKKMKPASTTLKLQHTHLASIFYLIRIINSNRNHFFSSDLMNFLILLFFLGY